MEHTTKFVGLELIHDPCFDWKFGPWPLGGWVPSKIEVIWVLGVYSNPSNPIYLVSQINISRFSDMWPLFSQISHVRSM